MIKWFIDPDPHWITGMEGVFFEDQSRIIAEHINSFPRLTSCTAIGDFSEADMLALVGAARLESLDLRGVPVTDEGITTLADCPSLRYLDVSKTAITGSGLVKAPRLPTLEGIVLSGRQAAEGGRPLFERLVTVRVILVIGEPGDLFVGEPGDNYPDQFDDDDLDVVVTVLRPTQRLMLSFTRVTSEHFAEVKAENPELTIERRLYFPVNPPGLLHTEMWTLQNL